MCRADEISLTVGRTALAAFDLSDLKSQEADQDLVSVTFTLKLSIDVS